MSHNLEEFLWPLLVMSMSDRILSCNLACLSDLPPPCASSMNTSTVDCVSKECVIDEYSKLGEVSSATRIEYKTSIHSKGAHPVPWPRPKRISCNVEVI